MFTLGLIITNLLCLYAGYRIGIRIVLSGVRRTLHYMGGEAMEQKFLDATDAATEDMKKRIKDMV